LPWYTKGFKKLTNLRNKFYKRFSVTQDPGDWNRHLQHKREFEFLNKFLYNQYIASVENGLKSNPNSFWRFINSKKSASSVPSAMFLGNLSSHSNTETANLFASYFKANFEPTPAWNDSQTLNAISPLLNLGSLTVLEENIQRAVEDVDDPYTPDCDGIPAYFLKHCIEVLCVPLKILFDKSLSSGHFADRWKVASVTPILKSGPKNNIANYRPIAKISIIAKLFERIVAHKLSFLVKTYISISQHGFVAGRSITTNLAVFSNYCIHAFIYTDFAKAFDKVSHSALLAKLARLGIHSGLLNWIKSYLHHRLYRVNINGKFSDSCLATSGLPQGSAMGPLLFIIFINDVRFCLSSECLLNEDD